MPERLKEDGTPEREFFTAEEIGHLLGISARMVLMTPIKQVRLGPRTIRYRLEDVYEHIGVENPNL